MIAGRLQALRHQGLDLDSPVSSAVSPADLDRNQTYGKRACRWKLRQLNRIPGCSHFGHGCVGHDTPCRAVTAGTFFGVETQFAPTTLSAGEADRLTALCTFISANGSGFGVCRSCRLGGLGAVAQQAAAQWTG